MRGVPSGHRVSGRQRQGRTVLPGHGALLGPTLAQAPAAAPALAPAPVLALAGPSLILALTLTLTLTPTLPYPVCAEREHGSMRQVR